MTCPLLQMAETFQKTLDSFIVSLEFVYRELVVMKTTSQLTDTQSEAVALTFQL